MPKQQPNQQQPDSSWSALSFAWELGYSIVVPLVILLVGGVFFDKHFGTSPRFTFIGVGVSFVTTIILLIFKVRAVIHDFDTTPTVTSNTATKNLNTHEHVEHKGSNSNVK